MNLPKSESPLVATDGYTLGYVQGRMQSVESLIQ